MSKYLTFPVIILNKSFESITECTKNAIDYCLYDYSKDLTGTDEKKTDAAEDYYRIKFIKGAYQNGMVLYESIPLNSPKTSISRETVLDFNTNSKTEFAIACFLAFAALRSILQRQPYTKVTNEYLLGRMAGNNKPGETLPTGVLKYSSRYQLDKIKQELQTRWGLKLYGNHTRGFYVSFKLTLVKLMKEAEVRRNNYKAKQLKNEKELALKAALSAINNNST